MNQPLAYTIPVQSFDLGLLPPGARKIGSTAFRDAVTAHFIKEYADKGETVIVTVDDRVITVQTLAQEAPGLDPILALLNAGRIAEAVPMLEQLARSHPSDVEVRYNLGIAYSELGRYQDAIAQLEKAVALLPTHSRAWTGIGVAQIRLRNTSEALKALKRAVEADPDDGYGQRNLGAVLMMQGQFSEALPHLQAAVRQLPDDPQAIFGLGQCAMELGGDHLAEADAQFLDLIQRFPAAPMAEAAKQARTQIAHKNMRGAVGGGVRPDVVAYIAGALDKFEQLGPRKAQEITFEIAMLGQRGLNINDPETKYELKSLPGQFTGLHLLAMMYTGIKRIDPSMDAGVDFSREYDLAVAMNKK